MNYGNDYSHREAMERSTNVEIRNQETQDTIEHQIDGEGAVKKAKNKKGKEA